MHQAIVLGLGSMFNHSAIRQNIGWKRNLEAEVIVYSALRDIEQGEELLISYGPYLTFRDVEAADMRMVEEEDELSVLSRIDVVGLGSIRPQHPRLPSFCLRITRPIMLYLLQLQYIYHNGPSGW